MILPAPPWQKGVGQASPVFALKIRSLATLSRLMFVLVGDWLPSALTVSAFNPPRPPGNHLTLPPSNWAWTRLA